MLKCHKGLELDTIPEFDLGEKTESSEALNCVPTVERSSSRNFARLSRRALFLRALPFSLAAPLVICRSSSSRHA